MYPTNESNRRKRRRLFEQQAGRCHWCGQPMRWMEPAEARRYERLPDDMCTLDHLEPRWHPDRGKHPGALRCVAACRRCNNERDRDLVLSIPPAILRKASQGQRATDVAQEHAAELRGLHKREYAPAEPLRFALGEVGIMAPPGSSPPELVARDIFPEPITITAEEQPCRE